MWRSIVEPLSDERIAELERLESERVIETMGYISAYFTKRELRLIANCCEYAEGDPAGLPGHNLMMLVAKIIQYHGGLLNIPDMLDEMIEQATDDRRFNE
jgi:hypothetical protein